MLRKEWLLLLTSTAITLVVSIGLLRWLAPGLLGIAPDLQMVQVSEEVPPFFEGVFRTEDYESSDFIINDPYLKRAKPLFPDLEVAGPNDILGFRNRGVSNVADVIAIGDSQTYGINATLEQNWPNQLASELANQYQFYSMATGGWGAVEYLEIFDKALYFQPHIIIIAFYTGNDPLDSFKMAYSSERWQFLRKDTSLGPSDIPDVVFPAPESERWSVTFKDGVETIFTPTLRYASNQDHPAVHAGYDVMAEAAHSMSQQIENTGVKLLFTIIPTKELVYAKKITQENIPQPDAYKALIEAETGNLQHLADALARIPNARYVDVLTFLQDAALQEIRLYRKDINGHPMAAGYSVIARSLASAVRDLLPDKPSGLVAVSGAKESYRIYLVRDNMLWKFATIELIQANGWSLENIPLVTARQLATFRHAGTIDEVDPQRFGPVVD